MRVLENVVRSENLGPDGKVPGERSKGGLAQQVDDVRINAIKELVSPANLLQKFPVSENASRAVYETRRDIHRILHGADDRLLAIMGPCSIHDTQAAKEDTKNLLDLLADAVRVRRLKLLEKE